MKALVCYNPKSGKQKLSNKLEYVKTELEKKYDAVDIYATTGPQALTEHLREVARDYDLVLISGGDGTLNEAVTGLIEGNAKDTALSYIPAGTCNDVGSMLHLKKRIKKALANTLNGERVRMDICRANEKCFAYVCGSGKFIDIAYATPHKLKKRIGKAAYFLYGAKELAARKKMHLKLTFDGETVEGDYYVALALNSDHVSGFHIRRRQKVKLNDGIIDLTLIESKGILSWHRLLNFVIFGDKNIFKYHTEHYHVSNLKIESAEPVEYTVDGEYAFKTEECNISLLKEAVTMIVPMKSKKKYFMN